MAEIPRHPERRYVDRQVAHEHAEQLRHRVASLAASVAESEDAIAEAYEESARLRPHAADRLQEAARHAREFAAHEREQYDALETPDAPTTDDETGSPTGRRPEEP